MRYEFTSLEHLTQVLQAIEGRREFIFVDKGAYSVINYVIASPTTFPPVSDETSAILRECRGLIFDASGRIMSRPFHKFFNVGEKEETAPEEIDLEREHVILEKLDGSMIRPLFIDGDVRWGSKMGLTDVSAMAEEHIAAHPHFNTFALFCKSKAMTPIFEFCSRQNRIVIDYPSTMLVLTALRHNNTGAYVKYNDMKVMATEFGIDVVRAVSSTSSDMAAFLAAVRSEDEGEGYVIRFEESGHMVKVKTEWYISLHRSKAAIGTEKGVIRLILEEKADDIRATLGPADRERFERFECDFLRGLRATQERLLELYEEHKESERKVFASGPAQLLDKGIRNLLFVLLRESRVAPSGVWKLLVDLVLLKATCKRKIDEIRSLWGGVSWTEGIFAEDDG